MMRDDHWLDSLRKRAGGTCSKLSVLLIATRSSAVAAPCRCFAALVRVGSGVRTGHGESLRHFAASQDCGGAVPTLGPQLATNLRHNLRQPHLFENEGLRRIATGSRHESRHARGPITDQAGICNRGCRGAAWLSRRQEARRADANVLGHLPGEPGGSRGLQPCCC